MFLHALYMFVFGLHLRMLLKRHGAAVGIGKGCAAAVPWCRRGDWYMDVLPPSLQALPTPSICCRSF